MHFRATSALGAASAEDGSASAIDSSAVTTTQMILAGCFTRHPILEEVRVLGKRCPY